MRLMVVFFLALLTAVVNAHFQLQFPPPRGPFNAPDEVKFCDGYPNAASNRSLFPLSGGYITLKAGHPSWTSGVLISTSQNPTNFAEFALINGYAAEPRAGNFCLPLDLSKSNVTGLQSGQNVTLQVVFLGGDGSLYQCADVTLTSNLNLASTVTCSNVTATATAHSSSRISAQAKSISFITALVALVGMALL